jgi:hypothetical protein
VTAAEQTEGLLSRQQRTRFGRVRQLQLAPITIEIDPMDTANLLVITEDEAQQQRRMLTEAFRRGVAVTAPPVRYPWMEPNERPQVAENAAAN